jgi:hypothetical protein
MMLIEFNGWKAAWHDAERKWVCDDDVMEHVFNDYTDQEKTLDVSAPFREGGVQQVAFDSLKKKLPGVKILKKTEPEIPPDEEGLVY